MQRTIVIEKDDFDSWIQSETMIYNCEPKYTISGNEVTISIIIDECISNCTIKLDDKWFTSNVLLFHFHCYDKNTQERFTVYFHMIFSQGQWIICDIYEQCDFDFAVEYMKIQNLDQFYTFDVNDTSSGKKYIEESSDIPGFPKLFCLKIYEHGMPGDTFNVRLNL